MPWKAADNLARVRLNQKGLGAVLDATSICSKADELAAGLFHAVSVRNGVLHVRLHRTHSLPLKLIEGKLLQELNSFATSRNLQVVHKLRLTFEEDSGIL